jgi:hypothetical protein
MVGLDLARRDKEQTRKWGHILAKDANSFGCLSTIRVHSFDLSNFSNLENLLLK